MNSKRTRHRLPPEERHAQLLHIAVKVAAEKGLGRTVHADVARAAGVSVATVFLYFPNRQALVKAIVKEVDRFYRALAREYHTAAIPAGERFRRHVQAFDKSIEKNPNYATIWLEWSSMVRNEYGLWDDFLAFQDFIISTLAKTIRACQRARLIPPAIVPRDAARLWVAGAYALTQLKFMNSDPKIVKRYLLQLTSTNLNSE